MRLAILLVAFLQATAAAALEPGAVVPGISLPVLQGEGERLSLRSLEGRVLYVDFWASWCVPCRVSMPKLDALHRRYGPRGFTVVGVNKDTSAVHARRFLQRVPVSFPLVHDGDDSMAEAFGVSAMPSGYLVDRRGVVRHVHRGFSERTAAEVEREIEALLEERS